MTLRWVLAFAVLAITCPTGGLNVDDDDATDDDDVRAFPFSLNFGTAVGLPLRHSSSSLVRPIRSFLSARPGFLD